jgi:hypothetical protein
VKDKNSTETKLERDEWMMMPPTQDGLAARMDPTKIRPGKFRSGKSAGGPKGDGIDSIWTETPEQKRKRLENEVLGIQTPAASTAGSSKKKSKADEEAARKIKEYNVSTALLLQLATYLTSTRRSTVASPSMRSTRSPNRKKRKTIPARGHLIARRMSLEA